MPHAWPLTELLCAPACHAWPPHHPCSICRVPCSAMYGQCMSTAADTVATGTPTHGAIASHVVDGSTAEKGRDCNWDCPTALRPPLAALYSLLLLPLGHASATSWLHIVHGSQVLYIHTVSMHAAEVYLGASAPLGVVPLWGEGFSRAQQGWLMYACYMQAP